MKLFNTMQNVGKARHLVNFHDGVQKHKDGSRFFDVKIFSRKQDAQKFVHGLLASGYVEKSSA